MFSPGQEIDECICNGFRQPKIKDRITPHVTNFFRLRLTIEKQEGKRSGDGRWVCVYVCMFMYSEWVSESVSEWCECGVCEWGMWEWVKWVKWSEVKWSEAKRSEGKWSEWVGERVSGWVSEWVKWSEVKWSEAKWSEGKWSEVERTKWSEGKWSEVERTKWSEGKWSEWMGERVSGWVSEWVSEWVGECVSVSEWVSEWMSEWVSEWVSEWMNQWVSQWVSGGDQGRTPAEPRGIHPTPWQCTLSHACHAKEAETKGRQRNPGAYIQPLGNAHCPTPATQKRRRPRDASGTPGRTSDPLAVYIVPRLPRKRGGDAHCPTPATQKRRRPRDASGTPGRTSDPLAVHIAPHLPRKRDGDQGTPAEPRGVHPTPWQCTLSHACHAKEAETKGRQRNPGAYIRPLGSTHCPTPATQKGRRPRDASGTPGRTSDPLAMHIVPRLPRKRGGDQGTPAEPRGVHPTPWQCTLSHACHAKEAETKGRQRNPGAYIQPLGNAHCPTPATQKRRRPRDASGTPGRTSNPLAMHIVPRLPRKRGGDQGTPAEPRGVHPTPWQWTLSHACHAKEAEEWVSEWVTWGEWDEVSEWVSEWVGGWVSEWVSEWV